MKTATPSNDSVCPMCGKVPGHLGIESQEGFVWNGMTKCFICEGCHLELAIEFHEEESCFFELASRLLGLGIWELKKAVPGRRDCLHREKID